MSYTPRPNTGALFKNDRREKDSHPEYKGDINIDGTDYTLSAWVKETKAGRKFFSLSVRPKQQRSLQDEFND
jgi:hypothetical protein